MPPTSVLYLVTLTLKPGDTHESIVKMHGVIQQQHVVHRKRRFDVLSLDLVPLLKIIVHFHSNISDKLLPKRDNPFTI